MAPSADELRVRLIQIREKPDVIAEEQASFIARTGLRPDQLVVTDALRDPLVLSLLDDVDALLIGGSGAYSVTKTYRWTQDLIEMCLTCAETEMPLFGACWGHQFIGRAFGGEVINDPERSEMGTVEVELTPAGEADPLFGSLPGRFPTQMGHHDRISILPPTAIELATNEVAPYQAIRLDGLPIYGTQFHSELDEETERQRIVAYRDHYPEMADDAVFQATIDALRPSPHADDLMRRWLMIYAVEGGAEILDAEDAA